MKKSLKRKKVSESLNILIKYIKLWSVLIWIIVILYITYQPLIVKKSKEHNTKLPQLLLVHGRVQTAPNFMKSWDGRHFLTVVGAGAFSMFTESKSTRPLLILEINYLHTADPCIDLITQIFFKK